MNYHEAKEIQKNFDKALQRKEMWDGFKTLLGDMSLKVFGSEFALTQEERRMIFNILDNSVNDRYENLKERMKKDLNIDVEV